MTKKKPKSQKAEKRQIRPESEDRAIENERERRRRAAIHDERMSALISASPILTAQEAAAYCNVSYSYMTKQLARYGREKYKGDGRYVPPSDGLDLMQARPEKIGRTWYFMRADIDRVLCVRR